MNLPGVNQQEYLNAKPFPHCVIDGVFSDFQLKLLLATWPKEHEHTGNNKFENKKGSTFSEELMGATISSFIKVNFQSQKFISFLEDLTGITGLISDCRKFALHETFSGGSLASHLDYTINKATGLQLRINVILYLNKSYKPEYNGNLDLYENVNAYGGMLSRSAVSIEPLFNRMVIFTMDAESPAWHGHSKPLACPEGMSRKSIALNYFTIPQKQSIEQGIIFKKSIWKELLPPIIYKLFQ